MADDSKRRRGRKRGRGQRHAQSQRPDDKSQDEQPDTDDEAEEPDSELEADDDGGSGRRRFGLPFGRGGDDDDDDDDEDDYEPERAPARERQARSPGAAPMDFWRRGRARPYREAADRQRQMGLWQRITGLYFPPWVPVVGIIVVVFGILGVLFILRGQTGAPRIADHWHATYEYIVCGQKQPDFPSWSGGVHTHSDGIIHMHPFDPSEEGAGARLVRWFEYGGGRLDGDEVRAPGSRTTYKNGDLCDDGSEGVVQVFANGQKVDNYTRYIAQDGDTVQIIFGPPQDSPTASTGIDIPDSEVTRTVAIDITDSGDPVADSAFSQTNIDLVTGEAIKLDITNTGTVLHGLSVAGADGDYAEVDDNFSSQPTLIEVGGKGSVNVRFNDPGTYEFRDTSFVDAATGTFTVTGDPVQPINLTVIEDPDSGVTEFLPSGPIEVVVGKTVNLIVKNQGDVNHGLTIAGEDGELRTEDDIQTSPGVILPGEQGKVSFVPHEIGEVLFEDIQDARGAFLAVEELTDPDATPAPDGQDVEVDKELALTATDTSLDVDPAEFKVQAGESFRITITNGDEFVLLLRMAGPDGEFKTSDDLVSEEIQNEGDTTEIIGTIDEPGTYEILDDFHPGVTATLTVE